MDEQPNIEMKGRQADCTNGWTDRLTSEQTNRQTDILLGVSMN